MTLEYQDHRRRIVEHRYLCSKSITLESLKIHEDQAFISYDIATTRKFTYFFSAILMPLFALYPNSRVKVDPNLNEIYWLDRIVLIVRKLYCFQSVKTL